MTDEINTYIACVYNDSGDFTDHTVIDTDHPDYAISLKTLDAIKCPCFDREYPFEDSGETTTLSDNSPRMSYHLNEWLFVLDDGPDTFLVLHELPDREYMIFNLMTGRVEVRRLPLKTEVRIFIPKLGWNC